MASNLIWWLLMNPDFLISLSLLSTILYFLAPSAVFLYAMYTCFTNVIENSIYLLSLDMLDISIQIEYNNYIRVDVFFKNEKWKMTPVDYLARACVSLSLVQVILYFTLRQLKTFTIISNYFCFCCFHIKNLELLISSPLQPYFLMQSTLMAVLL